MAVDLRQYVQQTLLRPLEDLTLDDVRRLLNGAPGLGSLRVENLLANRWSPSREGEALRDALLAPRPPPAPLPQTAETDAAILTALRNSQLPLGSLHLGRRLGSTNGLRAQLKRLVEQGLIVRLDGPEKLYTLTERSDGARARLRQSLRDTKLQLKRLREDPASRPSPELLRFGETLSGHQADIFRERTIARNALKLKDFAARWNITRESVRLAEDTMLRKLRLFLQQPNTDTGATFPTIESSILNSVSFLRLQELAREAGLETTRPTLKADFVSALLAGTVGLDEFVGALTCDELRKICQDHEIPDSGPKKTLLARIFAVAPGLLPTKSVPTPRKPAAKTPRPTTKALPRPGQPALTTSPSLKASTKLTTK